MTVEQAKLLEPMSEFLLELRNRSFSEAYMLGSEDGYNWGIQAKNEILKIEFKKSVHEIVSKYTIHQSSLTAIIENEILTNLYQIIEKTSNADDR